MKTRSLALAAKALLAGALLLSGVVHAVVAPAGAVASADVGTDGDGMPRGLTAEEEEAWAFEHLAVIHVRP